MSFRRLEPPKHAGRGPTVADVLGPDEGYERRVKSWAESVWSAWRPHRETIRSWTRTALHEAEQPMRRRRLGIKNTNRSAAARMADSA